MTAQSDDLRRQAAELESRAKVLEQPITQAGLHQLYQERRYSEIADAQANGRLDNLLNPGTTDPKEA